MSRPEDGDGGFLGRWAKRKQEVQLQSKQEQKPAVETPVSPLVADQDAKVPAQQDAPLPLPSLDDVLPGGDVSVFLQKHVPDALRNAALRKAWLADPEISGFIEMADYQWDFTRPDSIPGWSSSIGDFDVKGLIEKVFHNVAEPEKAAQSNIQNAEKLDEDAAGENTQNIIMDTKDTKNMPFSSEIEADISASDDYVAVQNNDADSDIYPSPKKRHGGALPS